MIKTGLTKYKLAPKNASEEDLENNFYDDVYTLEQFTDLCEMGCFIDSDGSGLLGYEEGYIDSCEQDDVYPSDILDPEFDKKDFTHVIWFNKYQSLCKKQFQKNLKRLLNL